jgi:hypothetical protein
MYYCCIDLYKVLASTIFMEDSNSCVYSYQYSNTQLVIWYEISYEGQ